MASNIAGIRAPRQATGKRRCLEDIDYKGTFMFELGPFRKKYINGDLPPKELLRKVAAFPKTFAERYGTG